MKTKHFLATMAITAMLAACVSSESDKLKSAREVQEQVLIDASAFDSTLKSDILQFSTRRDTMGTDSTLATDSIAMMKFVAFKTMIGELEGLRAEFSVWRNDLKLLPTKEELSKGAKNPFGNQANDAMVASEISAYQSQLTAFVEKAKSIREKE